MSKLGDVIYTALNEADERWQHDVAPHDAGQYVKDMADAVTAAVEQALSVKPSVLPGGGMPYAEDPMVKLMRDQNQILRDIHAVIRARR